MKTYFERIEEVLLQSTPIIISRTREPNLITMELGMHLYKKCPGSDIRIWDDLNRWWRMELIQVENLSEDTESSILGVTDPVYTRKVSDAISIARGDSIPSTDVPPEISPDPIVNLGMIENCFDSDISSKKRKSKSIFIFTGVQRILKEPHYRAAAILHRYNSALRHISRNAHIIFLVPEDFKVPTELVHSVTIVDHELPSKEIRLTVLQSLDTTEILRVGNKKFNFPTLEEVLKWVPKTEQFNFKNKILNLLGGLTKLECLDAWRKALLKVELRADATKENRVDTILSSLKETKLSTIGVTTILEPLDPVEESSIGGLDILKSWLKVRKSCFTEEATLAGVDKPQGVALVGPPGNGKSVCAQLAGKILDIPVLRLDLSKVYGHLIGMSEGRILSAINEAKSQAPCVLFIDEVDKGGLTANNQGDNGIGARVLGTVLNAMAKDDTGIFWLFTANAANALPPEILRKGRLDEIFSVLSPNRHERESILRIHCSKRNINLPEEVLLDLVSKTDGYVSSELEAICREAKARAFYSGKEVDQKILDSVVEGITRLSDSMSESFAATEEWAKAFARNASSKTGTNGATLIKQHNK